MKFIIIIIIIVRKKRKKYFNKFEIEIAFIYSRVTIGSFFLLAKFKKKAIKSFYIKIGIIVINF